MIVIPQLLNKLKANDAIHFQLTLWLYHAYYSVDDVKYRGMQIYDNIRWGYWQSMLATKEFQEEMYKWNLRNCPEPDNKKMKVTLPGNCTASPDRVPPAGLETAGLGHTRPPNDVE